MSQVQQAILGLKQFLSTQLGPGMFHACEKRQRNGYVGQYDSHTMLYNVCIHQVAKNIRLPEGGSMVIQYWEVIVKSEDDGFLKSTDWRLMIE